VADCYGNANEPSDYVEFLNWYYFENDCSIKCIGWLVGWMVG
jgi:hypothetical protein